jgi:hypothetical protein
MMRTKLAMMPDPTATPSKLAAKQSKQQPEFYTVENLPPRELMEYCIAGLYGSRSGLERLLCPIAQQEAAEMMDKIYCGRDGSPAGGGAGAEQIGDAGSGLDGHHGRVPKHQPRSELCQVLLLAALGSQLAEELIGEETETSLFTSGRWYLDVAFGRDASALHRIRANLLAGLYLILAKNIAAKEYFSV